MCTLIGICCAQVYIPTSYSTSSGIVRNVPTTVLGIPANTYFSDGNRVFIAAQIPNQYITTRLNEDVATTETRNKNEKTQNLRQLVNKKDEITKALLREDSNEKLNENNSQRKDSIKITEDQFERIRDTLKIPYENFFETTDKEMLRTHLKGTDHTDTLARIQGFINNDRLTAFNRFRGIN